MSANLNTMSDLVLISLIDNGSEEAFKELYNRHWQKLYNEAYKRLGDVEKSKDIIQEVFIKFWQQAKRNHILDVLAYLKQAVRYQVIRTYHEDHKQVNFELPLEMVFDASVQIEEVFFAKELSAYIEAWLSLQPERRRQIFHMRFIDDLSTKEISAALGISQKTVQKTLLNAIANLRISMEKFASILPLLIILSKP